MSLPFNAQKKFMRKLSEDKYESENRYTMQREYGETPNGNEVNGRWVLRNDQKKFIDYNQYRQDLAEKYGFIINE